MCIFPASWATSERFLRIVDTWESRCVTVNTMNYNSKNQKIDLSTDSALCASFIQYGHFWRGEWETGRCALCTSSVGKIQNWKECFCIRLGTLRIIWDQKLKLATSENGVCNCMYNLTSCISESKKLIKDPPCLLQLLNLLGCCL